jgi:hypothetical protein
LFKSFLAIIIFVFSHVFTVEAQNSSIPDTLIKPSPILIPAIGVAYTGGMFGLYHAWYKNYDLGSFHFFNDNKEWLQMDKAGHLTTAYTLGRIGYESFLLAGHNENTALWLGGSLGSIFLTGIEVLDGFSTEWGFSVGDAMANIVGSSAFIFQQKYWNEQRISFKYSYQHSGFATFRPDLLGSTKAERLLKDYNGQVYWASFNLKSFFPKANFIPNYVNFAIGYGATGMLGGNENIWNKSGMNYDFSHFERERRFLLSFDIDLTRIPCKKRWFKLLSSCIGFIKIPSPTIEFRKDAQSRFYPIYF